MMPPRAPAAAALDRRLDAILAANGDLRNLYLLAGDPYRGGDRRSARSKVEFLLWFAAVGKTDHPNIACFDRAYLAFLETRLDSGLTLFEDYVTRLKAAEGGSAPLAGHMLAPLLPDRRDPRHTGIRPPADFGRAGVSVVGFPLHTLGIGEDARCLFKVLRALGVPTHLVDIGHPDLETIAERDDYAAVVFPRPIFPTVVFCMPLFEFVRIKAVWGSEALRGRHVVGYWPWELTALDPCWSPVFREVDEIWASSRFLVEVYGAIGDRPVHHVPLLVDAGEPDRTVARRHGIEADVFTVLVLVDFNSTLRRKNALGAIAAFRRAFPDPDVPVRLLIKTTHLESRPEQWRILEQAIGEDDRILVIDGALERSEILGLIAGADVFVSLHRAEGFGRVIAEAMLMGTAVVATDWSGSRDLVRDDTGFPIRCDLVDVAPDEYPEAAGQWAEPDLDQAAAVLRRLWRNPAERQARVARARAHVKDEFGMGSVAQRLAARLAAMALR